MCFYQVFGQQGVYFLELTTPFSKIKCTKNLPIFFGLHHHHNDNQSMITLCQSIEENTQHLLYNNASLFDFI